MAYTETQLTAIETAAASGVLTVRVGDETITYQSLADMQRQITVMRAELGVVSATTTRRAFATPYTSKGL